MSEEKPMTNNNCNYDEKQVFKYNQWPIDWGVVIGSLILYFLHLEFWVDGEPFLIFFLLSIIVNLVDYSLNKVIGFIKRFLDNKNQPMP